MARKRERTYQDWSDAGMDGASTRASREEDPDYELYDLTYLYRSDGTRICQGFDMLSLSEDGYRDLEGDDY